MQEYLLRQAFYETGTQVGILRLQNVYGPGQSLNNPYTGVLSIFIQQLLEGRKLNIYEDGLITRDFVYVDDVVEAFLRILQVQECPDRPVDIGTGIPATILDVADLMIRLLRLEPEMRGVSGDFRPGDIRYAVADPSFAKSSLGWVAQTPIEDGISALIEWARADASCG